MVDFLVSRGHRYQDLLATYPLTLVTSLYQAANHNQRSELVALATAVHVGVSASLDNALNNGRAGVLKKFTGAMLQDRFDNAGNRPAMSREAAAFLGSLPVKKVSRG